MGAIPGGLETDAQPPMAVPLRHFVVGLGFLLAGALVGTLEPLGVVPGLGLLAHVHLLLVGWVCVTIMGATTQFVPVWSGVELHSRRLASAQLWLVTAGLAGFVTSLSLPALAWLPAFGGLMLVGFWVFVYNVGRTLLQARPWDVTERHFGIALAFFLAVTGLGLLLAIGYASPVFPSLPVDRVDARAAHATLAVFGAVLTTVLGALYQLGTMFTQSDLQGVDHHLQAVEEVGYPVGVVALAGGRLLEVAVLATGGGVLVSVGLAAMGTIIARRLVDSPVGWTPMLRRYALVAVGMVAWALLAAPSWLSRPLAPAALFGSPALVHLLFLWVVGFVVLGTLYHVVPFVVWVHRYSDRLGLESVPMIDDLYDSRVATADLLALSAGSATLVLADALSLGRRGYLLGGALATLGFVLAVANLGGVVHRHSPQSVTELVVGRSGGRSSTEAGPDGRRG